MIPVCFPFVSTGRKWIRERCACQESARKKASQMEQDKHYEVDASDCVPRAKGAGCANALGPVVRAARCLICGLATLLALQIVDILKR